MPPSSYRVTVPKGERTAYEWAEPAFRALVVATIGLWLWSMTGSAKDPFLAIASRTVVPADNVDHNDRQFSPPAADLL